MADLEDLVCHTVKEISVMCYHDHNALETVKVIFQPGSHLIVQMVGRLVQDQDIRWVYKNCRQRHTLFLTTGEMFNLFFMVFDSQFVENHMCLCLRIPALFLLPLCHIGKDRCALRELRVLRKIGDAKSVLRDHLALICFFQSGEDPKEGCFSCSIDADDPDLVSLMDPAGNVIKDHFISINFTDMLQIQNIHSIISLLYVFYFWKFSEIINNEQNCRDAPGYRVTQHDRIDPRMSRKYTEHPHNTDQTDSSAGEQHRHKDPACPSKCTGKDPDHHIHEIGWQKEMHHIHTDPYNIFICRKQPIKRACQRIQRSTYKNRTGI